MSFQKQTGTKEELQVELDTVKEQYLRPTADRVVDGKFIGMIADFLIGKMRGERILELGAGDQVWTPKMVARFPHVTTLDGSPGLLAAMGTHLAGKGVTNWTPVVTYFEDYVPQERFDVVVATGVLEHVTDPEFIVQRANQFWLKPGGTLVVTVPHGLSLHRRLAVKMALASRPDELGETDQRLSHKHCFTYLEMRSLIENGGFEVTEQFGMITKSLPNILLSHCSDEQLRGLFELGLDLPIEYSGVIAFLAKSKR